MKARGRYDVYICDHDSCKAISLGWYRQDNRMSKIVFGVHPEMARQLKKFLVTQIEELHYCDVHIAIYQPPLIFLLQSIAGDIDKICADSGLKDGLGCWISIIDPSGRCTNNFQLSYEVFEKVYVSFEERTRLPARMEFYPRDIRDGV